MKKVKTIEAKVIDCYKAIDGFSLKLSNKYAESLGISADILASDIQLASTKFIKRLLVKGYDFNTQSEIIKSKTLKYCLDFVELKQLEAIRVISIDSDKEFLQLVYDNSIDYARTSFFKRLESLSSDAKSIIDFLFALTEKQTEKLLSSDKKIEVVIASIIKKQKAKKQKLSSPKTLFFAFSDIRNLLYKKDIEFENFCMKLKTSKSRKSYVCNHCKPIRKDKNFKAYQPKNESLFPIKSKQLKHQFDSKTGKFLYSYFEYLQSFQSNICEVDKSKNHTTKHEQKTLLLSELFDCQKHCYKLEKLELKRDKYF